MRNNLLTVNHAAVTTSRGATHLLATHKPPLPYPPMDINHELLVNPATVQEIIKHLKIDIEALAKDIVLYGNTDFDGVLAAHSLTQETFAPLSSHPVYIATIDSLKKHIATSPYAGLRLKAADMLASQLEVLNAIAQNPVADDKNRIKAIEVTRDLAGANPPVEKSQQAAPTVVLNIGGAPREIMVTNAN